MNNHTQIKIYSATKARVFSFLSKIQNLPKWATGFAKEVKSIGGKYKVLTPQGEIFFRMESDEKIGIIDMYGGPTEDQIAYSLAVLSRCLKEGAPTFSPIFNGQEFQMRHLTPKIKP